MNTEDAVKIQGKLESERANIASYWQDIANFSSPRKAYITNKQSSGQMLDFHRIFDGTAIQSLKTMSNGFHSHLTNPSTRWFQWRTRRSDLNEIKRVKTYFRDVEDEMFTTLNSSNFYSSMQEFYPDFGSFGVSSIFQEEDPIDLVRFKTLPLQEVFIQEDARGRVNRIYRKFQYTALQAWELWGRSAGETVMLAIEEKNFEKKIDILHWIAPRDKRDPSKEDELNMPFESKWAEITKKHLIKESGYLEFPVAVGRFYRRANEPWADSPVMDVLADIKMINVEKKTLIRGAMKIVDPPLDVPDRGYIMNLNMNPSGINYRSSNMSKENGIRTIATGANIGIGLEMIAQVKADIEEGMFVPLFKAFSQITKQMTIPEVQRRIAENSALLGPAVGRMTQDVLGPTLERTFNILLRAGRLPEPPEEILGEKFEPIYTSQLAKAQRATELLSLERSMSTVAEASNFIPSVLHKIKGDVFVDEVFDINGANMKILRDKDEVAEHRALLAEEEQARIEQEQVAMAASTAETISKADKNMRVA